jgi:hypothetical protein
LPASTAGTNMPAHPASTQTPLLNRQLCLGIPQL